MKRVREHLPIAAFGSALWWMAEHALDKGVEHMIGTVLQAVAHLAI